MIRIRSDCLLLCNFFFFLSEKEYYLEFNEKYVLWFTIY